MYCVHCGNQLNNQDSFCSKCGHPISKESVSSIEQHNLVISEPQFEKEIPLESEFEEIFVGKKYDYFIQKWNKLEREKSKTSWNWAAFFLGPFWFGYRKMYLPVVLLVVCYFFLDLIFYLTQYQYTEESYFYDPVENAALFPISIVLSMFGNYYYLKHTNRNIDKVNLQPLDLEQKRTWLKRKGGTSWLGVLFTILIMFSYGVVTALLLPTNVDHILTVKDGSFFDYPTTTVGEAFDDFFGDPQWEYVSADSPFDVVRFTGSTEADGESVNVLIDFIITEDSFEIHSAKVNGVEMSDEDFYAMLDAVFAESEGNIFN